MTLKSIVIATAFVQAHIILVAGFVPTSSLLPIAFGALALTSMALSLVLAARWRIVDLLTGGPDKSYVAHRILGFFALLGTLGHWGLASSVGNGMIPFLADGAEEAGTFAALALMIMTAAAMIRAIPYHFWKASHMLMGPMFLIAVYHTAFVAGPLEFGTLPWTIVMGISGLGILGWARTLWRKMKSGDLMTVKSATPFEGGVDITLCSNKSLPAYRAGQFATLAKTERGAETHPFTIAGGDMNSRRFIVRVAGDWTADLIASVKPGDKFRVGQGEGRFLPQTQAKRTHQLWIAGGVGITPFLAAMEKMEPDAGAHVTLIYCIRDRKSAGGLVDVERHQKRLPQLTLITLSDVQDEYLTSERLALILRVMPKKAQLYLCGPEGLKETARRVWAVEGQKGRIHEERFDFRGAYNLSNLIKFMPTLRRFYASADGNTSP